MKKLIYLYIIIISWSNYCLSQTISIQNSVTSESIPYVNISLEDGEGSFTSDENGFFQIPHNKKSKSLIFDAIGYEPLLIDIDKIKSPILLSQKTIAIKEVVIYSQKFLYIKKYGKAKRGIMIGVNFDAKISQFIKYIPNNSKTDKVLFINSVSFYTNTSSKNRKINIIFYSVGQDGKPNEMINDENIICNLKEGRKLNKIDLKKLKITLPIEGVFVGIQHLLIEDNKYYPSENNPNSKYFCYEPFFFGTENPAKFDSWHLVDGIWKNNKKYSLNLEVEISD